MEYVWSLHRFQRPKITTALKNAELNQRTRRQGGFQVLSRHPVGVELLRTSCLDKGVLLQTDGEKRASFLCRAPQGKRPGPVLLALQHPSQEMQTVKEGEGTNIVYFLREKPHPECIRSLYDE